jgi:hypothetical protein
MSPAGTSEPREAICHYCQTPWLTRSANPRRCPTCHKKGTPCARCGTRFKAGRRQWLCDDCSVDWDKCGLCGKILSAEAFPPNTAMKNGRQGDCYVCYRKRLRGYHLKKHFGVTPDVYEFLLGLQDGTCAICLRKPRTRLLAIDHDHKTGQIRGLLCTRCNHKLLGSSNEDPAILRRAADYLERPPFQLELNATEESPLSIKVALLPTELREQVIALMEAHPTLDSFVVDIPGDDLEDAP